MKLSARAWVSRFILAVVMAVLPWVTAGDIGYWRASAWMTPLPIGRLMDEQRWLVCELPG
jgi:hypothetical protein